MLFWTVVLFISYSMIYFVVSQRKIRRLQNSNLKLMSLKENNHGMHNSTKVKGKFEKEFAN